ncbi:phosphotransferase [Candidatus Gracilibacteria bacterium]|nr:phosphotransferase [Candidatus Gracilibacteria bacterium]
MKKNYEKSIIEGLFHQFFPEKGILSYNLCEGGIENSNFLIRTTDSSYVLKIFEGFKNHRDMVCAEVDILIDLEKAGSNVPEIFISTDGRRIIDGPDSKETILTEYIDGEKHRNEPLSDEMLFSLGHRIAVFDDDLAQLTGKYNIPETHMYDLKYIFRHPQLRINQPEYASQALLLEVWSDIDEIRSIFEELPVQIIHNDLHSSNIIFKNNEPYFIDFSDFLVSPIIQEIATSLVSWCFHHFWYPQGMTEYLRGYESVRKLTTEEKKCLFACIECRMLNIILAAYIPDSGIDNSGSHRDFLLVYYEALKRFHEFGKENFIKYIP